MSDAEALTHQATPLERYQTLQTGLDLLDQGLSIFDGELRLVAWNRAYVRLLCFPDGMAYLGAPFESFIRFNAERGEYGPGDPDQQVAERLAAARTFAPHEIERVRPDGRVLRIRGEPVPGHGFVTLYSDVTEQRRAEQTVREQSQELENRVAARTAELLRSEERVRLIMDSIPALVAYFDRRRVYQYLNRVYADWFGVDTKRPETVSARAFLGEAVYSVVKPQVMRALAGTPVSFEYAIDTCRGGRRWVRTSLVPEIAVDGTVAGCFELTFDTTELRRSQELVARAQKLESLGHLTGGLAHDFNNILTVIIGNLAALVDVRATDPQVLEFVQPALDGSRRGAELVKGLLSFARRQPLQAAAVDIGVLMRDVARLVRRSLPEGLDLSVDVGDKPLWTWIDPNLLEQALLNMILNARDATPPPGSIRLRARRAELVGEGGAALQVEPGDFVRVEVEDSGTGMDPATLARMFEPFFTTKHAGRGTGLGMAVVYGFVKQSGGAIDVRSSPGQGTTVSLWLPAVEAPEPDFGVTAPAELEVARRGLALLVDDDLQVRRVIRRHLLDLGYAVMEADNGAEALSLLDGTESISLVLSDLVMPGGIGGREIARAARLKGRARAVVLMSGSVPDEPAQQGVPMLPKPFTKAQLAEAIKDSQT